MHCERYFTSKRTELGHLSAFLPEPHAELTLQRSPDGWIKERGMEDLGWICGKHGKVKKG